MIQDSNNLYGGLMKNIFSVLWHNQEGQDLVEYAMLLGLLTLACVAGLNGLAGAINNAFSAAGTEMNLNAT